MVQFCIVSQFRRSFVCLGHLVLCIVIEEMKKEINPVETSRADAFEMWMKSPMPMVTLTKTLDVKRLYRGQPAKGHEVQHAPVLVYWQGSKHGG